MYLSRLLLNPRNRQVQRETADPYNLHRTILNAFDSDRETASVLHRLETNPRSGQLLLLVQSQIAPNWHWLVEKGYLLPADPFSGLDNPAVKEINLALRVEQTLRFRLVANPTVKKKREGQKHSNRVPLVREENQAAWLACKSRRHGFRVLDFSISHSQRQTSRKKGITIYTVQYDGRLQITDAAKFREALQKGIGPAKAFGCGLLSIAPG